MAAGINNPSTLVTATTLPGFDKFIDSLDKKASSFKLANNQTEAHKLSFPILANRRLKAFRMFLEWQVLMGEDIDDAVDAAEFNDAQMSRWCDRIVFLEEEATSNNFWHFTQDVPKLDGLNKWFKWLEAMETALQCKRTPGMGIPMSYLIWKEAAAISWADIAEDDPCYEDMDMLLILMVQLHGPVFKRHNQLLFNNLRNLTTDGECWQFIQHLKAQNNWNGCKAFLLLKQQAKGDEEQKSCVQSARNAIRNTIYTGKELPLHVFCDHPPVGV